MIQIFKFNKILSKTTTKLIKILFITKFFVCLLPTICLSVSGKLHINAFIINGLFAECVA